MIDLRSDTVTKPTPEMRRAMAEAEVGDDVYGEDPTIIRLELRAAEITGKEAALFVPTGTMGNVIAIKLHTQHGQEVVCDSRSHLMDYELAMVAWFAGCLIRPVETEKGILSWEQVKKAIKPKGPHWAPTGVVEIENTHNMAGGRVYPVRTVDEICEGVHGLGLKVHMDGARLFNAAEACGRPVREIVKNVDTVMFCLSKALGAPVGSMLAGTQANIDEGRLLRKRLGGGMRQAGILAAAGLLAIEESPKKLCDNHARARELARKISAIPGIQMDPATVESNILIFDVTGTGRAAAEISADLKTRGVLMNGINPRQMRAVTHYDVSAKDCDVAAAVLAEVAQMETAVR